MDFIVSIERQSHLYEIVDKMPDFRQWNLSIYNDGKIITFQTSSTKGIISLVKPETDYDSAKYEIRFMYLNNPWSKILIIYIKAPLQCNQIQTIGIQNALENFAIYHSTALKKFSEKKKVKKVTDKDLSDFKFNISGVTISCWWKDYTNNDNI